MAYNVAAMIVDRIIIVGLGLMGGSLARALRNEVFTIIGVDSDLETRQTAIASSVVAAVADDLTAVTIRPTDLVILATPVRTILAQIAALPTVAPRGCMVLDLGSTKTEICAAMDGLPESFQAIGGHPMCGREVGGFANSSAGLFRGQNFLLVETGRTTPTVRRVVVQLIQAAGAQPVLIDAARHDAVVAAVSHVPYLAAALLMQQAAETAVTTPEIWNIAASGFRDTSRLAGSNPTMMRDIVLTNRDVIAEQLLVYRGHLDALLAMLDDADRLAAWMQQQQEAHAAYRSLKANNADFTTNL